MLWEQFYPFFETLSTKFSCAGFDINLVGGCVRDYLLQKEPKDYDCSTDATPDMTKKIIAEIENVSSCWDIGEKFGTVALKLSSGTQIEITTYRQDITIGRHPDVMFSKNIEDDLGRRDFSMNSIAFNKNKGLIDPFNGQQDIKDKLIKATGNPYERFAEDPLRMLRAVRFISQLNIEIKHKDYWIIENDTYNAICNYAQSILTISRERWLEEMNKLLLGDAVSFALDNLKHSRLLYYMIPEIMPLNMEVNGQLPSKNLWLHTLDVVKKSPKSPDIRWAALLHDIAKPQTRFEKDGDVHFFQHEVVGADMVEGIARRFKMSNEQRRAIKGLVALHQRIGDTVSRKNTPPVSVSALRRVIRECEIYKCDIKDLVSLFEVDCSSKRPGVIERQAAHTELLKKALEEIKEEDLKPKLPSGIGTVIMEKLNLPPGPEVGKIKQMFDRWLLDGDITPNMTAEEIVDYYLEDLKLDVYI